MPKTHTPDPQLAERIRRLNQRQRGKAPARSDSEVEKLIESAHQKAANGKRTRERLRHRSDPDSPQRREQLQAAYDAIHEPAQALLSEQRRLAFDAGRDRRFGKRVRAATAATTAERKRLWKMLNPERKR